MFDIQIKRRNKDLSFGKSEGQILFADGMVLKTSYSAPVIIVITDDLNVVCRKAELKTTEVALITKKETNIGPFDYVTANIDHNIQAKSSSKVKILTSNKNMDCEKQTLVLSPDAILLKEFFFDLFSTTIKLDKMPRWRTVNKWQ